jgi:hypothetical protein
VELFETTIDSMHRAGDVGDLAVTFAHLAVLFDRLKQPEVAATLYGATERHGDIGWVLNLPTVLEHLGGALGESAFDERVAAGAAMELGESVQYAQVQIRLAQRQFAEPTAPPAGRG